MSYRHAVLSSLRRRLPWATLDALLALALLAVGQWQVWGGWHDGGIGELPHGQRAARALLVAGFVLPLAWRRRWPLITMTTICTAVVVQLLAVAAYVPFLVGLLPMVVANYTVAAYASRWRLAGLVIMLGTEAVIYARIPEERVGGEVLFALLVAIGTWVIGDVVRIRTTRAQWVLGEARTLVAQTAASTAAALADERARIARELHDVIAHSVSVMGVQAGAARTLMERDPEAAREALRAIESAARSSVAELQRLLSVLREDGAVTADARTPAPGLGQLTALVDQVTTAGLEVDVHIDGDLRLPTGLDLAAYRIVQEGLTNALKHAGTKTALRIVNDGEQLRIAVRNAGPVRQAAVVNPAGHGLIGMRERVEIYGGRLHVRPQPDGGFLVEATLPVVPGAVPAPVR